MERTVGVLGGMGPEATAIFFHQLVLLNPVRRDQDHFKIVVVNNPKIPDRNAYLTGTGESPVPLLLETARELEKLGADFIVMPCNTAHTFWKEISAAVAIPVLNIVEETVSMIRRHFADQADAARVGILATPATIRMALYQKALTESGLIPVVPGPEIQQRIVQVIALIKGSREKFSVAEQLRAAIDSFRSEGVEALILGCTELGLAPLELDLPIFDSLQILAGATVRYARYGHTCRAGS